MLEGPSLSGQPKITGGRVIRTTLAVLFALTMLRLVGFGDSHVEVVAEIRSLAGVDGEIFYARSGEGYVPERRVAFSIEADGRWHTYRIVVPEKKGLARIRIDPGSGSGEVALRRIGVTTNGRSVELAGEQLLASVGPPHSMRQLDSGEDHLRFVAIAPDPFVDFTLPAGAGEASRGEQVYLWLGAAIIGALFWLFLGEFAGPHISRRLAPYFKVPKSMHRGAKCFSDPGILVVAPQALAIVVVMLAGTIMFIALNLHQSSVGVWEEIYPAKPVSQMIDFGTPRRIRSDEWNTQSPWVLGQVASGSTDRNLSIGGEKAPLLASVPVANLSAIAQIKFYGFYLFDSETGFSWWWAYKSFGLLFSFFWLFLLLTRGHVAASALGSIWIYGSSFTQWWLSSNLPELLIAFALATTGAIYLLFARRRIMIWLGVTLIAYASLNLLLHLYPPFILPLAYLGVAIVAGYLFTPGSLALARINLAQRILALAGAFLVIGVVGGYYLKDAMPAIAVMTNTVYPGHRIAESGDFSLVRLFYGYFELFRIGEARLPLPPTNASEASSFIILVPLLVLALSFRAFAQRSNALLIALALYCVVTAMWISAPLPGFAESAMQALGWSWSPPKRAVLGLGVGSIIASTILFARIQDRTIDVRPEAVRRMVPVMIVSCLLLFGWGLHGIDPEFFRLKVVFVASFTVGALSAGILLGRAKVFAAGLAVAIVPALLVNPLVSGLSAIQEKPILSAAKRQGDMSGNRWAVVGDFVFSQGLKAHGLEVITGSQMIPNREVSRSLDPENQYDHIWNRYAHVELRSDPGRPTPVYELVSQDLYIIRLDICGAAIRETGVTNIAYTTTVPEADLKCLVPLEAPADSGVRLFQFVPRRVGSTP